MKEAEWNFKISEMKMEEIRINVEIKKKRIQIA